MRDARLGLPRLLDQTHSRGLSVASPRDHQGPHDPVKQHNHHQGSAAPHGPASHGYATLSAHAAIVSLGGAEVNGGLL